ECQVLTLVIVAELNTALSGEILANDQGSGCLSYTALSMRHSNCNRVSRAMDDAHRPDRRRIKWGLDGCAWSRTRYSMDGLLGSSDVVIRIRILSCHSAPNLLANHHLLDITAVSFRSASVPSATPLGFRNRSR